MTVTGEGAFTEKMQFKRDEREGEPTIKDSVKSGIPESLTQASMTPWISAHTVVPVDQSQASKNKILFFF